MRGSIEQKHMIWACSLALLVTLFLFALLPAMRSLPSRRQETFTSRSVNLVKLEKEQPETREVKEPEPEEEKAPPEPKLELPVDLSTSFDVDAPVLRANPDLPELDTTAFRADTSSMIFGASDLDAPLTPTFNAAPVYPFKAKRLGISGAVTVTFRVGTDGGVSQIKIVKATPEGIFEKAVIDAVKRWRFKPGEITGEKVAVRVSKTIQFNLNI